jgi:AbrB family looped-hinge helix DNA binding protein
MNATAEIDRAGRLVIPKKLRDALHITPGTRLVLREEGQRLIVEPESRPRGLYMKKGTLVYDSGVPPHQAEVDWAAEDRERRMHTLLNELAGS